MGVVMIRCISTGQEISTGIEVERDTFVALPNVSARLKCPACGNDHFWTKAEAWLSDEPNPEA